MPGKGMAGTIFAFFLRPDEEAIFALVGRPIIYVKVKKQSGERKWGCFYMRGMAAEEVQGFAKGDLGTGRDRILTG